MSTEKLLNAIINKDVDTTIDTFDSIMTEKMVDAIEQKKQETAQTMFQAPEQE